MQCTGYIDTLIHKRELQNAIRFIHAFNMCDKFHTVELLKLYWEDLKKEFMLNKEDEKEEVLETHLAELKAVVQFANDNNLECEDLTTEVENEIVQLRLLINNNLRRGRKRPHEAE